MKKKTLIIMLFLLLINMSTYAENIEITIPEFDILLNDTIYNNATEEYPFIVYKNINYFPVTWDISSALG